MLASLIPKDMMAAMPFLQGLGLNERVMAFACALMFLAGCCLRSLRLCVCVSARFAKACRRREGRSRAWCGVVLAPTSWWWNWPRRWCCWPGAGLLGKSLYRLLHTDIGMQPDHIATVRVEAQPEKYSKPELRVALARKMEERVASLPGVKTVGITTKLPIEDADWTTGFRIIGSRIAGSIAKWRFAL